jgi:uncharacterized membrane protein YkoI
MKKILKALIFAGILTVLTACGNKVGYTPMPTEAPVDTVQRAQEIALECLNRSIGDVTDMTGEEANTKEPAYEVTIFCGDDSYYFLIDAATGKILKFKE